MPSTDGFGMDGVVRLDDFPTNDVPTNVSPMLELGATGLKRASGTIDEEFLPALRGRAAIKVYREMATNDAIIGALLYSIDKLLRNVKWTVVADDTSPEQEQAKQFIEECMEDMSHTFSDLISEILSMLPYGFSWHEIVYKKRVGPWEKDPKKRSRFSDGRIGWRKIPIRSQETLLRWVFDDDGGVKGFVQMAPPYYKMTVIPIEKSLLFRTGQHKGNPEGYSMLRNAYRSYFFKKRMEEFEAIGVERDLAGLPVAKVPSHYMNAKKESKEYATYQAFKKMVQNIRRDEHDGLVLPLEYDPVTKQPLFDFELMSSGGTRTFDTNALIQRYEQRILMACLADFILVGHEQTGSYAMHADKTGIFKTALNSIANSIADVFNRFAIPRLFEVNGMKIDALPRLVPSNVDSPNLAELAQFMSSMGGLGMTWFPDPDLEEYLRNVAQLPDLTDDVMEAKKQMAQQDMAIQQSQSAMMAHGQGQKEQMVQAGHTPEQAEQAAQMPNEAMQAHEVSSQYKGRYLASQDPQVKRMMDEEQNSQMQQATAAGQSEQFKSQSQQDQMNLQDQLDEKKAGRDQQAFTRDAQGQEAAHRRAKEMITHKDSSARNLQYSKDRSEKDMMRHRGRSEGETHKRTIALEKLKGDMSKKRMDSKAVPNALRKGKGKR